MTHDRAQHLLPAYIDRQLNPLRRFLLGRHVATCPSCLNQMEVLQAMRTALRMTGGPIAPRPLWRCGSDPLCRGESPPVTRRRPRHFGFAGSAMAGALAGVALTLLVVRQPSAPDPLVADVVADHVRSLMGEHLMDVPTSDQHTVKPWLSARLDLSPVVKDFAAEGYPLIGGRLDYVEGHRAAAIVYRRDKHIINLFAFVSDQRSDAPPRQETLDGFNVIRWRMGGLSYIAVSDVEAGQLQAFVRLVMS